MKTTKKTMAGLALTGLLAFGGIAGSLAYLTDSEQAVNSFTSGKVQIELSETAVDEYGKPIAGAARVTENSYKLIPGKSYVKDPTVTIKAGSEDMFMRVKMTVKNGVQYEEKTGTTISPASFMDGYQAYAYGSAGWSYTTAAKDREIVNGTDIVMYINYRTTEPAGVIPTQETDLNIPLYTGFTIPAEWDHEQLEAWDDLEVVFEAQAIQKDGSNNAFQAWNKYTAQNSTADH